MKRYLTLLLTLALILSLAACGSPAVETAVSTPAEPPEETLFSTPTETPSLESTETPAGSFKVYTDWSKLEPYQPKEAVYTRRYEGFTDTLIPADDYGPLSSFAGTALTVTEEWEGQVSHYDYYLYGLRTSAGEVVVDPVFTSVRRVYDHKDDDMRSLGQLPVYVLTKTFPDEDGEIDRSALCAEDGSWCTDYLYQYDWERSGVFGEGTGLIIAKGRDQLAIVDLTNGREQVAIDLAPYIGEKGSFGWRSASGGYITVNVHLWESRQVFYLLFAPDGTLLLRQEEDAAHQWVGKYEGGMIMVRGVGPDGGQSGELYGYMDLEGSWVIPPTYVWAENFENGLAPVRDRKGNSYFIDRNGIPASEVISCDHFYSHGDYWYFLDSKERPLAVYDRMGQPVKGFPTVGVGRVDFLEDGWVSVTTAEALIVARGSEMYRFPSGLGKVGDICEEGVLLGEQDWSGRTTSATFVTWEGEVLSYWPDGNDVHLKKDDLTGKNYVTVEFYEENRSECYDLRGTFVVAGEDNYSYPFFYGGLLERGGNILTTPEGETVFCWPIHSADD